MAYTPYKMKGPSLYKFNAGLRKASAEGKLDNNPKFKAAVDASPNKKYKSDAQRKAVHASKAEKAAMKKMGCAMCNYGKKKCTCSMASPKKYGKTTMKKRGCGKKY